MGNRSSLIHPGHQDGWGTALLANTDQVATWSNNEKTKILIVSPQVEVDKEYIKEVLKTNKKTNRINFEHFEVLGQKGVVQDENKFINEFIEFHTTVVVLAFQHETKGDLENSLRKCPPGYAPSGSVADILNSKGYVSEILLTKSTCMFIETRNVWKREDCILTSRVEVTGPGVREQLEKARGDWILKNSSNTRVLIISGGHGNTIKNNRVTPAGGLSCFSDKELLDYSFYKADCEMIGIMPEPDICLYNPVNKEEVVSVDQNGRKPSPIPKSKWKNPSTSNQLNIHPDFDKILFDVLNIAHFGTYDNTRSVNNVNKLITYLKDYKPTFIIIAWCFSSNGDLAMALRSKGFFSKLLLEHDLRNITQDLKAKLSDQQVKILKKAELTPNGPVGFKDFHLAGSSGTGKTVLAMEIIKIKLAQLREKGKVKLFVLAHKSEYQTPKELINKLEADLKDLVDAYEAVDPNFILLDKSNTADDLFKNIKKEISNQDQSCNKIVFVDEVKIAETEVGGEMVRDFTKLNDLGDKIHTIYCHSPLTGSTSGNDQFNIILPNIKPGAVYSDKLDIRYRNNERILDFLQFLTGNGVVISCDSEENGVTIESQPPGTSDSVMVEVDGSGLFGFRARFSTRSGEYLGDRDLSYDFFYWSPMDLAAWGRRICDGVLMTPCDTKATSLPRKLPGSPNPILWLDCGWNWEEMDQCLTRDMVQSLAPGMETWGYVNGIVISGEAKFNGEETGPAWKYVGRMGCAGIEADIVVTVGNIFHYEPIARARRQLIVLTGTDTERGIQSCLQKAEQKLFLSKRIIAEKPDCFRKENEVEGKSTTSCVSIPEQYSNTMYSQRRQRRVPFRAHIHKYC